MTVDIRDFLLRKLANCGCSNCGVRKYDDGPDLDNTVCQLCYAKETGSKSDE